MNNWKKYSRSVCIALAFSIAAVMSVPADEILPPTGPGMTAEQQSLAANTAGTQSISKTPSRLPSLGGTYTTSVQESGASGASSSGTSVALPTGTAGEISMPEQPEIAAQGAVLYDATNNRFLFEKNGDTHFYPASITKLMTALLVAENCSLDETVTFSASAVTNLESGAVTLQVKAGDQFSVKDCMYGLLLKSANEIANGLAEHVAGSVSAFADLMNAKAASLGCTNTHFVNPNGLNNSQHYTSARDMALIASAAFSNSTVRQIAGTLNYDFPATSSVPTVRRLTMGHKMLNPANAEYYEGIVGGKTGYTSLAGNTLVTCAERNGVRLIAVILKSSQTHYSDTKKLLDYGFEVVQAQNTAASQTQSSVSQGPGASSGDSADSFSQTAPGVGISSQPGGGFGSNVQATVSSGRWIQTGNEWQFLKADGTYAAGECLKIDGKIYCFKSDGWMAKDWNLIDGVWYYFSESGAMAASQWIQTGGYWYYVDANGSLFTGGTTPDGYKVDDNGVWIQ